MKPAHRVVTVIGPKVAMFELSVACEVFGLDRSELVDPWYRHRVAAAMPGPHFSPEGVSVDTQYGLEEVADADTVIIPANPFYGPPPEELLDALRAARERGARLLSVCTGAFVLAAAGLLDGLRATTHWMHSEALARQFPKVCVDPKVLYVDAGGIMTSAGTAAGIDLMLYVVRLDHGAEVANAVARRMVVPPHRDGGQAQFVDLPVAPSNGHEPLAGVMGWMLEHVGDDLSVEQPGPAGRHQPPHLRPPVPGRDGHHAAPVDPGPAHPARPAPAGDHRRRRRTGGPALRLRLRRRPPPALHPGRVGIAPGLPPHLPGDGLRPATYLLLGREPAYPTPRLTHLDSCRLVRTSSTVRRSQPRIGRPRISIGSAGVIAISLSESAGSTRTRTPPCPLAAMAMFPPTRKASPPNMACSETSTPSGSNARIRSASSLS